MEAALVQEAIGDGERGALPDAAACWSGPPGTEPLIRVMVEAPSEEETEAVCANLCRVVEQALG